MRKMMKIGVLLLLAALPTLAVTVSANSSGSTSPISLAGVASSFDGPAELPRGVINSSPFDTPAPGATLVVSSHDSLQQILNQASCGDTILLQAGAVFSGTFVLPRKNCDDQHWVVLRSNAP